MGIFISDILAIYDALSLIYIRFHQVLSIVLVLSIHPTLSSVFADRSTIRLLFRALGRFTPQPTPAPTSPEFDLLQSQVCDKCLRVVQQVFTSHTALFLEAMREKEATGGGSEDETEEVDVPVPLVLSVVRVSVGATRNLEWYPALLRSADILQVCPITHQLVFP